MHYFRGQFFCTPLTRWKWGGDCSQVRWGPGAARAEAWPALLLRQGGIPNRERVALLTKYSGENAHFEIFPGHENYCTLALLLLGWSSWAAVFITRFFSINFLFELTIENLLSNDSSELFSRIRWGRRSKACHIIHLHINFKTQQFNSVPNIF